MAKFVKTTDRNKQRTFVGVHSVEDDFELPLNTAHVSYEFIGEKEAREGNPRLFGEDKDGVLEAAPAKETAAEKKAREKAEKAAADADA